MAAGINNDLDGMERVWKAAGKAAIRKTVGIEG
jgi:hypothetical protein